MVLYSGRNAVVHACKTFPICPLWSVGESTNLKMRFLKNMMSEPSRLASRVIVVKWIVVLVSRV